MGSCGAEPRLSLGCRHECRDCRLVLSVDECQETEQQRADDRCIGALLVQWRGNLGVDIPRRRVLALDESYSRERIEDWRGPDRGERLSEYCAGRASEQGRKIVLTRFALAAKD